MDSQLVWRLLTDWKPRPSLLTAEELLAFVPQVRLLEGPEWAELGLEAMPGAKAGVLAAENGPGSLPSRLYIVGVQQRWLPP